MHGARKRLCNKRCWETVRKIQGLICALKVTKTKLNQYVTVENAFSSLNVLNYHGLLIVFHVCCFKDRLD